MRLWNFLFVLVIVSMTALSCKTNSTNPTTGPTNTGPYDTKGSDYVSLTANTQVSAHFRGAARTFDINGSLTQLDSMDRDRIAVIMSNADLLGLPGYAIGAYDDYGHMTNNGGPVAYAADANGIVYASDQNLIQKAIVLPNDLSAGSWNPDPNGNPDFIANLADHMDSYTTYNGNTYSNVIKVTASEHDSEAYGVTNVVASIYFAENVGPIQIDLDQVEQHGSDFHIGPGNRNYEKIVYSGSIARNGP